MMKFFKYHGAGNDFLLYDAREEGAEFTPSQVASLCDRHLGIGSDGLMVLSEAPGYDFKMDFFNPDGSGGMMCGNGGRCIVAFARDLGIAPQPCGPAAAVASGAVGVDSDAGGASMAAGKGSDAGGASMANGKGSDAGGESSVAAGVGPVADGASMAADKASAIGFYRFLAPDGPHTAWLLSDDGPVKTVCLGMKPVTEYYPVTQSNLAAACAPAAACDPATSCDPASSFPGLSRESSPWYLDTGTRHLVVFVDDVKAVDVDRVGRALRHLPEFAPVGVNVNFVEILSPGEIAVRTFEKGVEAETLACGTGITASALATWLATSPAASAAPATPATPATPASPAAARHSTLVHARCHDLTVAFTPAPAANALTFTDITLTGPAERVATILL